MPVFFYNQGHLDLDCVRTMGVNVKDNTSAIGYFGTGLKFAIATLLRTGHQVHLTTGGESYEFTTREVEIRGKTFNMVYMNEEKLAYTTDLGKDWEPWMAFRELASNAMDEMGGVQTNKPHGYDTVFFVRGEGISKAYEERGDIFCITQPVTSLGHVEVHPGRGNTLYYRGVRVKKLEKRSEFTYNIQALLDLTEDRTVKYMFQVEGLLEKWLPTMRDPEMIEQLIFSTGTIEESLNFSRCDSPSDIFLDTVEKHVGNLRVNMYARQLLQKHRPTAIPEANTTTAEQETMRMALDMVKFLGGRLSADQISVVDDLGGNAYAAVKGRRVYVTKRCIANGVDFLGITLYEEWIHLDLGYMDESRDMQQHLFDKVLELAKELKR